MNNVVEIRNLGVRFATDAGDVVAVDGVSLAVEPGQVLAIVGESGSGKSVTSKTILGMLPETATVSGAVLLNGTDVTTLSGAQLRSVRGTDGAMVFQEPSTALNPVYPVGWQIAEGLRAHGTLSRKEARQQAIDILRRVGIPDPETRVDYYPHQFSGGQKQRVVIAMALVLSPEVIIADEPTTALDVTVQAEILDLLRRARDEFGTAILLITHNMGVVADLADRVAVMYQGTVVEQADVRTLFAHPQHPYTQRLLAAVPRLGVDLRPPAPPPAADPVVVARDLEVRFPGRLGRPGFTAVDGVSFSLAPGEVLGLVGESGSGKTTIGRAIAGLTRVTGGSLRVLGHEMNGVRERAFRPVRSEIGFVFQDPASSFNPLLSIAECVAEPLVVHGRAADARAARPRVDELLEAVRLPRSFGDRFPHELSGGERQRASLARSLALNPSLLIADEPTSALDVSVQATVLDLFRELQQQLGFAALFISHDLAVVDDLSDRIAVLHHGRLVEVGPSAEVLRSPQDPYTQRLLASLPVPDPVEQAARRRELAALRDGEKAG
ncbi:MAG: ABC transporter ATP-binding protein [Actinomycetales bacterium]|nr:ABC transporter ATP-binding protein [Actinomycetales bacterium]